MQRDTDSKMFVLFNSFIMTLVLSQVYGTPCPSVCKCNGDNILCSDQKLTGIPDNLPKDTVYLNMNNNNLRILNLDLLRSLPKLQFLTLRDNQISKVIASESNQETNLEKLDLQGNCLKTMPQAPFSTMPNLTYLDLSKNSLSNANGIFRNLNNLVKLHLSDNAITSISNDIFVDTLNLETLDMKNNKLEKIDLQAFNHLERLYSLELTRNNINEITGSWQNNSGLNMLDLSQCQLVNIPTNLPSTLKFLNIGSNQLTSVTISSLENYQQLEFLVIDHNQISSIESRSFFKLEKLTHIDISDNAISVFPDFLPKSLRDINLDTNNISVLKSSAFSRLVYVVTLSLRNNKLTEFAPKPFSFLRNLKFLYMDGNPLRKFTGDDLAGQRKLELLSLNNCPIERIGLRPFIKLKSLKELHLAFITNNYLSFVADALQELPHLKKLNLQGSPTLVSHVVKPRILASLEDKLEVLNIMNGNLVALSPDFKVYLRNTRKIKLAGNPFHCDARLQWLYDWMKDEPDKFPYSDLIICATPNIVQGTPINSLAEDYLLSMSTSPSRGFFFNSEVSESVEITQEIIHDLDYADDLINYPVSDPEGDGNCRSDNVEESHASTNTETEILKYASPVNTVVIDVLTTREQPKPEETISTLCASCDTNKRTMDNRLGGLPQISTSEINHGKRDEIQEDNQDSAVASISANDNRLTDQVNLEGISSTEALEDENYLSISHGVDEINTDIVTATPLIKRHFDDETQRATNPISHVSSKSSASENNDDTTKLPIPIYSITEAWRTNPFRDLKNKEDGSKKNTGNIDREPGDIPIVVKTENKPPRYLKVAAIAASSGAGLLALSTGSLLIFVLRRFRKDKKEQRLPSEYPMETC